MSRLDGTDEPLSRWEALAEVARRVNWGHADDCEEVIAAILGDETPEPSPREANVGNATAPDTTVAEPSRDLWAGVSSGALVVIPAHDHAAMLAELERLRERYESDVPVLVNGEPVA